MTVSLDCVNKAASYDIFVVTVYILCHLYEADTPVTDCFNYVLILLLLNAHLQKLKFTL